MSSYRQTENLATLNMGKSTTTRFSYAMSEQNPDTSLTKTTLVSLTIYEAFGGHFLSGLGFKSVHLMNN